MKKALFFIIALVILTACSSKNNKEVEKNKYLQIKSKLLEQKTFQAGTELPCDIIVNFDRKNEEIITYSVTISSPKEDMNNIKVLVVHNYYTEDIFPSKGFFNKQGKLLKDDNSKKIKLKGSIPVTEDLDSLDLELKIYIEYIDSNDKKQTIYYKTT